MVGGSPNEFLGGFAAGFICSFLVPSLHGAQTPAQSLERCFAGIIVGARLGLAQHRADNARVFDFTLDDDDHRAIEPVCAKSRDLMKLIGDCGDEYR